MLEINRFVAIVGISADPPTKAHIQLAQNAVQTGYFNEVWILPCYKHRFDKNMISSEHRLNMCQLAIEGISTLKVSDYEIKRKSNGIAFETVLALQKDFPDVKFHWVIGMDNAQAVEKWAHSDDLRNLIPFWVFNRKGVKLDPKVDWYLKNPHTYIKNSDLPEVSSTETRRLLAEKDPQVLSMIDSKVFDYINLHNLYKRELHETSN